MENPSTKLMVAVFERTVCVQVFGRADFTCTVDLKRLITELWERGYSHFIFDLCECRMMDSTFLGVLADISLNLTSGPGEPRSLELFNANARIVESLENLGISHLFKMDGSSAPLSDKYEPLAQGAPASRVEVARTCLKAHLTLMNVNPDNVQKFKDVAQFLADDVKRLEIGQKS